MHRIPPEEALNLKHMKTIQCSGKKIWADSNSLRSIGQEVPAESGNLATDPDIDALSKLLPPAKSAN
jgi:hypothetical protein